MLANDASQRHRVDDVNHECGTVCHPTLVAMILFGVFIIWVDFLQTLNPMLYAKPAGMKNEIVRHPGLCLQ